MKKGAGLVSGYGALVINQSICQLAIITEGQLTLQKALSGSQDEPPDSLRIDFPKDEIPGDNRRRDGIDYMDLDSREEWMQRDGYLNLVKSTMGKSSKE
jgi:hypothetical protein